MLLTKHGFAIIESDQFISKWANDAGRIDHDQNALPRILPFIKKGGTVLDLGAYISDHTTAYARAVGLEGRVYAFEPNPKAFECLEYNTKDLPQVVCYNQGVGIGDGKYIIGYNVENTGASFLKEDERGQQLRTLDEMMFERCDFIKIDCEGFEVEILRGGDKLINRCKPILCIEINIFTLSNRGFEPKDVFSILDEWGYSYRNIYMEQPMSGDQYDIICFKP